MTKTAKFLLMVVIFCTIYSIYIGDSYKYTGFLGIIFIISSSFKGKMKIVDVTYFLSSTLLMILFMFETILNF